MIKYRLNNFLKNISGNFAVFSGILMVPIFGAAGVALDYSNLTNARTQMQAAADAAALAAAEAYNENDDFMDINQFVTDFYTANDGFATISKSNSVNGTLVGQYVEVTANATIPTYLMGVLNATSADVSVVAQATTLGQAPVEMALVIDNTQSMDFGSWPLVRDALIDVLTVIDSRTTSNDFYVTLVPYTDRVNIGTGREDWLAAADTTGTWEGCVEPKQSPISGFPYALEITAGPGDFDPTNEETVETLEDNGSKGSECAEVIIGPTQDINVARAGLQNLEPQRATGRFDDALLWGWRAVTEQWRGRWSGDVNYPSNNDERQKIVAMFTDGRTNINRYEMERRPGKFGNNNGSEILFDHFTRVCEAIKDDGVKVYIFDTAENKHAETYFRNCAEDNYFKVDTTEEMIRAIQSLSQQEGQEVRLSR